MQQILARRCSTLVVSAIDGTHSAFPYLRHTTAMTEDFVDHNTLPFRPIVAVLWESVNKPELLCERLMHAQSAPERGSGTAAD